MSAGRTPEEIRASIEANREELAVSITNLRGEVLRFTKWRKDLADNRQEATAVAAAAGFVICGGVLAVGGLLFGGRRRRKR
jgi:hypothetical protein